MHGVLHQALDYTRRHKLVVFNVAEDVESFPDAKHEMRALSEEEARRLLEAAGGDRFEALYVVAVTTGLREGELLGLRWKDVDLDRAKLTVMMNAQYAADADGVYHLILDAPKNSSSNNTIGLSYTAVEALRRHKVVQAKERLALGPVWEDHDLVFSNTLGGIMRATRLSQTLFPRLLKKAGLPKIRFHDLRHTAATLAIARGVPIKTVSEMLRHADIAITLRVYAHVTPHMQQQALDVMDDIFSTGKH
jgi:integrase